MAEANKTYRFTIAIKELQETVPNLFRYASAYKRTKGIKSKGLWEMFLNRPSGIKLPSSEDEKWNSLPEDITMLDSDHVHSDEICPDAMEGESYNLCHFWSNFEIARLDWYQSKECQEFFEMMERSGGFWMERVSKTSPLPNGRMLIINRVCSGVTRPFTHSPPVFFFHLMMFTTSVILGTVTPLFNTALLMRQLDNCLALLFLTKP